MSKIKTVKGSYIEDITGQTFNRLTVIELTDKQNNDNRWLWKCQCSCEKHSIVYTSMRNLKSGNTKSVGEKKVKTQLELLQIKFKREKTFEGCKNPETDRKLRYDFYLPDYNTCIEYDGFTHFIANGGWNTKENLAGIQYRDNIKNKFCKDNNIKLVRIPYTDFNKIDTDYILNRIGDKIEQ